MENTIKPMSDPTLRKLGLMVIVSVSLYALFMATVANPNLEGNNGMIIFGSVLGGVCFVFFLMFAREVKQFKKLHQ